MLNCALFPTTTLLHAFVGDWAGPRSAAQLSAHDVFQSLQVDLSNNHPCPCDAVSWRAAGKRKCASGYSALRAIRANVRNCAQLRPAVGSNVCNCENLCAIAPFRFARRFECEGRALCSHTWKLTTRTQPVGHFLVFGFQAGTSNWDFVTSSTCTGSTRSQAALISMLGRRRH